ncbi:MAG: arsenite methyltransferase [Spirochaetia bacterium]|jgi:arsenite methyltransferase|nr:arsenite methyltransferase [Spirochaetia bacterium]
MNKTSNDEIRKAVRNQYGKVAVAGSSGCGGSSGSCCDESIPDSNEIAMVLGYSDKEVTEVPDGANMGLGCGNPQAIASIKNGETVLDLGAGGGFDSFLAAKQVGSSGLVIGVDMTSSMVSKARENAEKSSYNNVDFRLGEIENLPVADNTVDVIISNCVINLSPEKDKVFKEAFRVLKPGGRLAISDIVATAELPENIKQDMAMFTGCMSGASSVIELDSMIVSVGFSNIEIKPKDESKDFIHDWAPDSKIEDFVVSATIQAVKPS